MSPGLQDRVDAYLALRRALGYQLHAHTAVLADYAAFAATQGLVSVTPQSTAAWVASTPGLSATVISRRVGMLRQFAAYLRAFDPGCQGPDDAQRNSPELLIEFPHSGGLNCSGHSTFRVRLPPWSCRCRTGR